MCLKLANAMNAQLKEMADPNLPKPKLYRNRRGDKVTQALVSMPQTPYPLSGENASISAMLGREEVYTEAQPMFLTK